MSSRISFGPLVVIGFLVLILVLAITFAPVIFGSLESETDFGNMTEQQNQSYNATTQLVQVSLTGFDIAGLLLVFVGGVGVLGYALWKGSSGR
jgi:hypothetical protein